MLSIVNLLGITEEDSCFEEARAAGHRPFTCTNVRVLAVDDEEMNLLVAKGVLGSYGIQVDTCLSGKAAIERCAETSYDIIFLDHMMPGFDGVETLRRIREMNNGMYKDLPVIALTANTISGAREMFRSEGFTEFIPKPIERSVLERVLRRVLPEHCMIYDTDTSHAESLSENSENGDAISQIKEKVSEVKDVHPYTDTVPEDSNTEAASRLWYQLCALSGGGYFCRIRVDKGGSIVISGYDPDGAGAIKNSIEIYLTIPL